MSKGVERGGCQFNLQKGSAGENLIQLEMFHTTVATLASITLSFEVMRGITADQVKKLLDMMNDQIIGVVVAPK